jgi:hypothetical protein
VPNTLAEITRGRELPEQHPARSVHYRLLEISPAAITPVPTGLPGSTNPTARAPRAPAQPQPGPKRSR